MSSRTVAVVLKAQVDDYVAQMSRARQHTTDVEKAARSATEQFRMHNEALTKVGLGMAGVGAAAAVGIGIAVKAASEYGAKMAQLQSLSHANTSDMQRLSQAAMSTGTAYGFTATQVAEAEIELSKAGRSASDMLGGDLKGALVLAAAGQMDVAKATEIGVTALTQFKDTGATIPQVADALAAGADKALGSVEDLGMALNQGGLVAAQMGLNLDDTVGTLSAFAQAGLKGSDAGTSLKNMFLMLQSPTKQSKDLLEQYNITAYDTQGKFVGVANLAGQLQRAFKGKSDAERDAALSTIFGSDAIRGANVLYKNGQDGIRGWTEAVDETGFASAQAAGKMNSLQGDAQKLAAAFQTDLIKAGSSTDGMFRGIVQSATGLVSTFGALPQPVMAVGVGMTAVVAATGLVGGTALVTIPKVIALRGTLDELGISGRKTAGFIGKGSALLIGVGLLAAGIASTAQKGVADAQQISLAGETVTKGWKGVGDLFKGNFEVSGGLKAALAGEQFQAGSAKILDTWSFGLAHFSDVYKQNEGQFDALGQQLAGLAQQDYGRASSSFADLVKKYGLGADETQRLLGLMPAYREELVKQAEAAGVTASDHNLLLIAQQKGAVSAKVLATQQENAAHSAAEQQAGIRDLAGTAADATHDVDKLADAISGFGSTTLDARAAQREFRQSVDDAREAAKKSGNVLSDSTKADRDKGDALDDVARKANAVAASFAKQPGGVEKAEASLRDSRKTFIAIAESMGVGSKKARDLADDLIALPSDVKTAYGLSGTGTALDEIRQIQDALARVKNKSITVTVNQDGSTGTAFSDSRESTPVRRAGGGPIFGSGPKGVDSVYAILAPGEHVLTAPEVDRMGGQAAVSAFRSDLMTEVQAYAKGGAVHSIHVGPGKNTVAQPDRPKPKKGGPTDAITRQKEIAAQAQKDADRLQRAVIAQKKKAASAQKAADKAQKRYDDIDGSKKNAAAKKTAKAAADRAKKTADAADQRVTDLRDDRDKARDTVKSAGENAQALRNDREDFVSAERRDPTRATTDPLQYVDQLRQMSRDDNYSAADRKRFDDQANQYERGLATLTKSADEAAQKLSSLKDASKQMHDSIQQSIAGGYTLGGASQRMTQSGWIDRGGIRFQTTSGGPSASSIAGYYKEGAGTARAFAQALQQLAGRGVPGGLLAELAGMGTEQGLPIAQALLAGSQDDLNSIGSDYAAIASAGDAAGTTVADANFAAQIAAADANAKQITDEITAQGTALQHVIAQAFGLPGYATGTRSATPGIHWVGEHGPELLGFGGGEAMLNAPASQRWVRGAGAPAAAPQPITVQAAPVQFPDTLLLQDAHGFEARFRVVAQQEIARDASHDAVLMMGEPAL